MFMYGMTLTLYTITLCKMTLCCLTLKLVPVSAVWPDCLGQHH